MKHIHAEVIHAYADGAKVQVQSILSGIWSDCTYPDFDPGFEYRIKPAAPKWPQTTMRSADFSEAWPIAGTPINLLAQFANVVLAHACESGALVPADKVREIEAKVRKEWAMQEVVVPEARDIAIAINVRSACIAKGAWAVTNDELNKLISLVK